MKNAFVCVAILAVVTILAAQSRAPEIDSIDKNEMRADLSFLASDAMRGRLTDTPTNVLAAEWIAARFERLGVTPGGPKGSYYQPYNLMKATLGTDNRLIVESDGGSARKYGQDFYPHRFSATASAKGGVVFVGFGMSSPERGYDDYRGDVKGKIVLALDHEPGERDRGQRVRRRRDVGGRRRRGARRWRRRKKAPRPCCSSADVHNHPGAGNFEAARAQCLARRSRPGSNGIRSRRGPTACAFPPRRSRPRSPRQLLARSGVRSKSCRAASETAQGSTPVPLQGAARSN